MEYLNEKKCGVEIGPTKVDSKNITNLFNSQYDEIYKSIMDEKEKLIYIIINFFGESIIKEYLDNRCKKEQPNDKDGFLNKYIQKYEDIKEQLQIISNLTNVLSTLV
jgi:hypothetical protein